MATAILNQCAIIAGVSFDLNTGFTYDGHMLNYTSGTLLAGGLHNFSAPSKESLHLALLTLTRCGRWTFSRTTPSTGSRQVGDRLPPCAGVSS